jgi:hypothetical protein
VAILASERMDQVVTSASHAVRASQPSTVAKREYDDGFGLLPVSWTGS